MPHAATPSLTDLPDGDIRMSVDFRQVYASVLKDWMQIDAAQVLGAEYEGARPDWLRVSTLARMAREGSRDRRRGIGLDASGG